MATRILHADCPSDVLCSSVDVILNQGWEKELAWTKTGDTIPYTNLNDFLHYA